MTVNDDPARVERQLAAGELRCPLCQGRLAGWGWARRRPVREAGGRWLVRPRRTRCAGCAATPVLLPVGLLVRRADTVTVIGRALEAKASGLGAWPAAVVVDRPVGTVADRFVVREVKPWRIAGAVSAGRLLSPDWPPESINTSSP